MCGAAFAIGTGATTHICTRPSAEPGSRNSPPGATDGEEPLKVILAEERWATIRHAVESLAIVAAGLWAFYIFIYQEKIKPAGDPASLTPTIAVRRLGRDARREILSIDARFFNSGKTEIDVAADAYNVWGEQYGAHDRIVVKSTATSHEYRRDVPLRARTLVASFAELRDRAVGGYAGRHITIEPGTDENLDWIIVVPRGEYDVIEAQIICVPVKTAGANRVVVAIDNDPSLGTQLHPRGPVAEDDDLTHFALIP